MTLTYQNPVFPEYFADPFVFRHEGVYYAVGTDAGLAEGGLFPILRSLNLVDWERAGYALSHGEQVSGNEFWAPEVAFHGGVFYLYYSVGPGNESGHVLRVATSDSPEGPYLDQGRVLPHTDQPFTIDAHPFLDDDGAWYLFYARDFLDTGAESKPGTALVVDRLVGMTETAGEERTVLRATQPWQRFMSDRPMYGGVYDWHTLEGPCVLKHGGRYYCLFSGGRWENESYGVDFAVADHPMGPWRADASESPRVLRTIHGKVLGPGHNSAVVGPDGETLFICYHAWDPAMTARRLFIDPLVWTEDGPRALGPTTTPQTIRIKEPG
ncbi:glycoside hydrolase family 43 protein [Fimbriimonas ginsengisoli]|uniref:Glycoside hydrolase family 43 protein n=1 Tax=Fimbriimonas ginsengisoli Gsoil 348 TaxID=661478 RepID=A0A068NND8_FIMGI|nr:glycoside hydrolase family 43 protein [Fimbriimonas ginsengisoli]AIE84275.1 glycoside hydrolase family 43 protein [Fimbriimonas ginsengisoli Gsoil 348]